MPKRTNEFQQVVAHIYSQIAPAGGRVTESALRREDGTGTEREVDVLIEHKVAGHDITIAVECRDHTADQNVTWIDALIGKYGQLAVNKVVAVSSSPFSEAAKTKAAKHNIDAITVNEALTTSWVERIERWTFRTSSFILMRIGTFDAEGLTYSEISEDGEVTHKSKLSEDLFMVLVPYFREHVDKNATQQLIAKIRSDRARHIELPNKLYSEFSLDSPPRIVSRIDGRDVGIERIVYGIGTIFHEGRASQHFALKEHALSLVKIPLIEGEATVRMLTDSTGDLLKIEVNDPRVDALLGKRPLTGTKS